MKAQLQQTILNLRHIENNLTLLHEIGELNVTKGLETVKNQIQEIRYYLERII